MSEEEIIDKVEEVIEYSKLSTYIGFANQNDKIEALQGLLDLYNKEKATSHYIQSQLDIANAKLIEEKEKNKITANDIENYKAEAYMLGRKDEEEAMKGVIERHYISKDKIREKVIKVKNRTVKDDFIAATQGKLNTIIDLEELLEEDNK